MGTILCLSGASQIALGVNTSSVLGKRLLQHSHGDEEAFKHTASGKDGRAASSNRTNIDLRSLNSFHFVSCPEGANRPSCSRCQWQELHMSLAVDHDSTDS